MKRSLFFVLASALVLMSCHDLTTEIDACGNNVLEAYEFCDVIDGVAQFDDGARVCADGLELVDINKFDCHSCIAVASKGACEKNVKICGNNELDAGEACDFVDGIPNFSGDDCVCPDGLELVDIGKFECRSCVAVATQGACEKSVETCGNDVLDADESCDLVDGMLSFSTGARVCSSGLELVDINKFDCHSCIAVASKGACEKNVETCGNDVLDADESCDLVDGMLSFSTGARVCSSGLELVDIGKFECRSCVAVATQGACVAEAIACGNNVLDDDERCDVIDGMAKFADGSRVCTSGLELADIGSFGCNKACQVIAFSGACVVKASCGNGSVDGQEICDASDAAHLLSGVGTLCLSYDRERYSNANESARVKCSLNCTLDDSACTDTSLVFRIATYNVHNLFDTVCDSGKCASSDYETQFSSVQYSNKISNIAKDIATIDADIVLLEEIEKASGLESLLQNSEGYVGSFGETGWAASIDVGIMVRGKIIGHFLHRDALPYVDDLGVNRRLARELLEVEVELRNGERLNVLVTHLISKVTDAPGIRRNGEARVIRGYLDTLATKYPDRLIVFGGDLNDTPKSVPIQNLVGDKVFNLSSADIPEAESYTYGNRSAIDHLIYRNGSRMSYVPKTTQRFCTPRLSGTSDHCALAADFVSSTSP